MPAAAAIPAAIVGSSVVGGVIQGSAAKKAAQVQADAAMDASDKSLSLQKDIFNTQQENIAPWLAAGKSVLPTLTAGTAPGGQFDKPFTMQDFLANQDPSYQFTQDQGQQAIQRSAAARGTLRSGGTMRELMRFGEGTAQQAFGDAYNRFMTTRQNNFSNLASVAGLGSNATGQSVNVGNNAMNTMSNTTMQGIMGAGGSQAAGIIGQGNAYSGIGQGISQYAMLSQMFPKGAA